jgi:hypothetical protein
MTKVQCLQYNHFTDAQTGIEFHSILDQKTGLNIGVADVEDEKDLKRFTDQPEAFEILSDAEYSRAIGLSGRSHHAHADAHDAAASPTEGAPPDPSSLHKLEETEEEPTGAIDGPVDFATNDKPTRRRGRTGQTIEEAAIGAAEVEHLHETTEDNPLEGAPAPPPSE